MRRGETTALGERRVRREHFDLAARLDALHPIRLERAAGRDAASATRYRGVARR